MNTETRTFPLDRVALALSLLGVVLGVIIAIVGRLLNEDFAMHGTVCSSHSPSLPSFSGSSRGPPRLGNPHGLRHQS